MMAGFGGFGGFRSGSSKGAQGILIAPNDALKSTIIKADVTLTGINDQDKINEVINTVKTNEAAHFGRWKVPTLYFAEGQITVSSPIMMQSGVSIVGSGPNNTIFHLSNNAKCNVFGQENMTYVTYQPQFYNFMIDGNYANNEGTIYHGIEILPQEYIMRNIWIYNCYRGAKFYGEGSYGGMTDSCMFQNNYHYGVAVGSDSLLSLCGIGGNGKTAPDWLFGAGGLYLTAHNTQILNNHLADNYVDIFSNYSSFCQISDNIFEAGIKENIVFNGRARANIIANNRFGGRHLSTSNNSTDSIIFREILNGETGIDNIITGNSFSSNESNDTGYRYCVTEIANCDYNLITNNNFRNAYSQSQPVNKVGGNTVISSNIS